MSEHPYELLEAASKHFVSSRVWASSGVWKASARAKVGKHRVWKLAVSFGLLRVSYSFSTGWNSRSRRNRVETQRDGSDLSRDELLGLHEQYATEIRACLDFTHRNLAFYVGLLSALLVALLAGLLQADAGDTKILALLIGPILIICLAELGYSTLRVFYHRFIDASLTLLNIQRVLDLDKQDWTSARISPAPVPSKYGGFIAQWVGLQDWPEAHPGTTLEDAKQSILNDQLGTPLHILRRTRSGSRRFTAITLRDARMTMWAFEASGVLLIPVIIASSR